MDRDEDRKEGEEIGEDGEQPGEAHEPRDETMPAPWETDDYLAAGAPGRQRHDAFTLPRRRVFLKTLAKTGCVLEGCRAAAVSRSTVYALQERDSIFRKHCDLALEMAALPVELAAWERGVTGIEEEVIRGGQVVGHRMKRSDAVLRLLLQGANPKKYGPRPGFTRKRLMAWERKQIEHEIHARMAQEEPSIEQVRDDVVRRIDNIRRHREPGKLAAGWTRMREGNLIPPGWTWTGDNGEEDHDRFGPADK